MYIIRLTVFEKHGRIEICIYFVNSSGLSFLYFAILSLSGTIRVCNDLLKMCSSWFAIWGIIVCTTYGYMLTTPLDLFEFEDFTIFIISVGSVGAHTKTSYTHPAKDNLECQTNMTLPNAFVLVFR